MSYNRNVRLESSSPEIDNLEMAWWDRNADLIERIWGMSDVLSSGSRGPYFSQVRELFLQSASQRPARVLELACGSGWPGRLLCSNDLHILGVDFSQEQIALAKAKANGLPCAYENRSFSELPKLLQSGHVQGVFVHCALHHLSRAELKSFASDLKNCPPELPIVFVEPVYFDQAMGLFRPLRALANVFYSLFFRFVTKDLKPDLALKEQVAALLRESDRMNWFLSPKEMPLSREEVFEIFSPDFHVRDIVPVTYWALHLAQDLACLELNEKVVDAAQIYLPILNNIDRLLINSGLMQLMHSNYLFSRIYLTSKGST